MSEQKVKVRSISIDEKWGNVEGYDCRISYVVGERTTCSIYLDEKDTAKMIELCADIISRNVAVQSQVLKETLLSAALPAIECKKEDKTEEKQIL